MDERALLSLMAPPSLEGVKRLLCIQPHGDDNEIGMGGIIAYLTSRGVEVDYLTVTDGSLGDIGLIDGTRPLAEIRREEAERSGRYLGVKEFFFLSRKDGSLSDIPSLSCEIAEIIRRGRYDAVAAPDPWALYEAHNDHVVTGKAAAMAVINASLRKYPEGTDTKAMEVKAAIFYFTQKPNAVIDITEFFQKKMESIAIHSSQISEGMLELYTGYFAWRGMKLTGKEGCIGEGVRCLRPMLLHCIPEVMEV